MSKRFKKLVFCLLKHRWRVQNSPFHVPQWPLSSHFRILGPWGAPYQTQGEITGSRPQTPAGVSNHYGWLQEAEKSQPLSRQNTTGEKTLLSEPHSSEEFTPEPPGVWTHEHVFCICWAQWQSPHISPCFWVTHAFPQMHSNNHVTFQNVTSPSIWVYSP